MIRSENKMITKRDKHSTKKRKTSPIANTQESCETSLCITGRSLDKSYSAYSLLGPKDQQPFYIKITSINRRDPPSSLGSRIQPPRPKIATNPQKSLTVFHERRAEFLKKGVHSDICFSSMLTPGKKMKEVIVYEHVLDKKLLWFLQIRLQLAETAPAKSGL
jgi:hypothetical protein